MFCSIGRSIAQGGAAYPPPPLSRKLPLRLIRSPWNRIRITATNVGHSDWARIRPLSARYARIAQQLLDADAALVGKTITDEVSLDIMGENTFSPHP